MLLILFKYLILAIFGADKYLRPGKDDDRLLELLEADLSEFEGLSDDENEPETEQPDYFVDGHELPELPELVDVPELSSEEDSDPEFDMPLGEVRRRLVQRKNKNSWKKADR